MIDMLRFLPRVFHPEGNPLQFIFFITARCNLACRHCFYAEKLNRRDDELSLDEIAKVSRSMDRLLWFSMTGGEPFLREDISRIAEIFYRNNKFRFLTITTNGLLRDAIVRTVPEICGRCGNAELLVSVSLDGLEETHNYIRRTSTGFTEAVETVRELKKLKKRFKNLNVATVTTCTAENQKELKELALFLKDEVRPDNIIINMVRGKPRSGPLGEVDTRHYFDFIKVQEEGWSAGDLGYYDFFGSALIRKKESLQKEIISTVFSENRYVIPCLAGRISCVMTETGDLYPCEILNKKIGNIRDARYDFNKLWYSDIADEIRRFIKDTRCYCTYECAITTNILFNFKQLVKMLVASRSGRRGTDNG